MPNIDNEKPVCENCERLRAALKPFADMADCSFSSPEDVKAGLGLWTPLKLLYAARDALQQTGADRR